jgi:DNA-directed RNA polymerase specialized sigma24 family protein
MADPARFRALFDAAYPAVRRYVLYRGVIGDRADDVVAETFLVAWRRLDDVPDDDPLPWLLGVARNVWLNQQRGDRRYAALLRRLPLPAFTPPPGESGELGAVSEALGAIDAEDQEILRLVAWDGLSAARIGEVLGCSPGAARVRLHRARRRLAAEMAKRSGDGGQTSHEKQPIREASDG